MVCVPNPDNWGTKVSEVSVDSTTAAGAGLWIIDHVPSAGCLGAVSVCATNLACICIP